MCMIGGIYIYEQMSINLHDKNNIQIENGIVCEAKAQHPLRACHRNDTWLG